METLRELVKEVSRTGILPLSNEEVVKYQDLIGHASVEENVSLLNSEFAEAYIRIHGAAYGTVAAVKYYLTNAEKCKRVFDELAKAKDDRDGQEQYAKVLESQNEAQTKEIERLKSVNRELERDMEGMEFALKEKDEEIIKLKARLYDLTERK